MADAAAEVGADALAWVLGGGEDHALVATFPASPPAGWRAIGRVLDGPPRVVVDGADGTEIRAGSRSERPRPLGWPLVTARPLNELVDAGWAHALEPVGPQVAQMGEFLRAELAEGHRYLPAGPNVLRAFTFPFDEVRVLIVGQDPYPTPGHAVGLSFSVAPDVRPLPRSLDNIFTEYGKDLGYPPPSTGDLTPWSQRGVMLLNRVLTVRPGNPASHRGKGWEAVDRMRASGRSWSDSSRWWRCCGAATRPR